MLPTKGVQETLKHSRLPTDDLPAKFEETCAEYVTVLEEIADTLKTLDDDLLQNVLGMETFQLYKKRQIERQVVSKACAIQWTLLVIFPV